MARILRMIANHLEENPGSLDKLEKYLSKLTKKRNSKDVKYVQVDLFEILSKEGEQSLHQKLDSMDLNQLKNIVRKYSLDSSKLAEKWKRKERLVKFIVDRIVSRNAKGQVFSKY